MGMRFAVSADLRSNPPRWGGLCPSCCCARDVLHEGLLGQGSSCFPTRTENILHLRYRTVWGGELSLSQPVESILVIKVTHLNPCSCHFAVCGQTGDGLTLRDDGKGGCTYATSTGSNDIPKAVGPFQPCRDLFPGIACASYGGALTLSFVYGGTLPFREPNFQPMLNTVGLGAVTSLWWLHVHIIHVASIPQDIRPAFLPNLTYLQFQLAVFECTGEIVATGECLGSDTAWITPAGPNPRRLVALPAVSKVYRMRDLFIQNTGFRDMMSLIGFTCPPGIIQILGNYNLVSLRGFENIGPSEGLIIIISPSPNDLSALTSMARCDKEGQTVLDRWFVSFQSVSGCGKTFTVRPISHVTWILAFVACLCLSCFIYVL
jgi:hypothetical protein